MPAVLIYVPLGKIVPTKCKGGSNIPQYYGGALHQVEILKQALGSQVEAVGIIENIERQLSFDDPKAAESRKIAERFMKMAVEGKPVIAMIEARNELEAYWRLAKAVSPDIPVINPNRLAIIKAVPLPMTLEGYQWSLDQSIRMALKKFEFKPAAQGPSPE